MYFVAENLTFSLCYLYRYLALTASEFTPATLSVLIRAYLAVSEDFVWLWVKSPCDTVRLKETLIPYSHNGIHLLWDAGSDCAGHADFF